MVDYECPNCSGGFSESAADDDCCPWCGTPMDRAYEPGDGLSLSPERTVPTDGRQLGNWPAPDSLQIGEDDRIDPKTPNPKRPGEWR